MERRLSATSVFSFSQGKTCGPSVHVRCMEANTLVVVQQLVLLTAVPGRLRTNCKLRRAVKCVFLIHLSSEKKIINLFFQIQGVVRVFSNRCLSSFPS